MPIIAVCEQEPSSAVAAADGDSSAPSCSRADGPEQLHVDVSSHHECYSDVVASTDVTAPEHLRHRSSWPEDALVEHLIDMRSC